MLTGRVVADVVVVDAVVNAVVVLVDVLFLVLVEHSILRLLP